MGHTEVNEVSTILHRKLCNIFSKYASNEFCRNSAPKHVDSFFKVMYNHEWNSAINLLMSIYSFHESFMNFIEINS